MTEAGEPPRRGTRRRWVTVVAVVLHVLVAYPYLLAGLVAPGYGVTVLWVAWLALLVVAVLLARRGSLLALAVPVAALALWFAVLAFGDAVLGWTA